MMETLQKLERDIAELSSWKVSESAQQINYPIDAISTSILSNGGGFMVGRRGFQGPVLFTDLLGIGLGIKYSGQNKFIWAMTPLSSFTVNPATDVFTSSRPLRNGNVIAVVSTDTLPTGLSETSYYTVVNSTGNTFKLSGVNVTDTGIGTHYFGVTN